VGKPISTDSITASRGQFSYARVLIEIDASKELVKSVAFKLPSGKLRIQPVQYEYEPKFCAFCKAFGHSGKGCKAKEPVAEPVRKDGQTVDDSAKSAPASDAVVPQQPLAHVGLDGITVPGPLVQEKGDGASQSLSAGTACANVPTPDPGSDPVAGSSEGIVVPSSRDDVDLFCSPPVDAPQIVGGQEETFETVTSKKKRSSKQVPTAECQDGDDRVVSRKAKQKGAQLDAKKGGVAQPKGIRKGSSPLKSR